MSTNAEDNFERGQTGATATSIKLLKSTFGPALVALKPDVFTQPGLKLGQPSLPLGADALAEDQTLTESTPAGALCGESTGLLAIVLPGEAAAKEMLASNPSLSATLITSLADMRVVWFKPTNRLPANITLDGVVIISGGIVPCWHPDPRMRCYIQQGNIPLAVDLGTLVFTGRLKEFLTDWTVRELYGPLTVPAGPRRSKLNPDYWGVWISQTVGVQFDISRGLFIARAPVTYEEIIIPATKIPGMIATMLQHARQAGVDVPAYELHPRRITEIMAAMKMFCSVSTPAEAEVLSEFVTVKLEWRPGSILSKNAVTAALLEFRQSRGLQPPAHENALRRDLRLAILRLLGIRERHDAGRWYNGLALASANGNQAAQQPPPGAGAMLGGKTEPQQPAATASTNQCTPNPV